MTMVALGNRPISPCAGPVKRSAVGRGAEQLTLCLPEGVRRCLMSSRQSSQMCG